MIAATDVVLVPLGGSSPMRHNNWASHQRRWFLLRSHSSRIVICAFSIHSKAHIPCFMERTSVKTILNCFYLVPQHSEPKQKRTPNGVLFVLPQWCGESLLGFSRLLRPKERSECVVLEEGFEPSHNIGNVGISPSEFATQMLVRTIARHRRIVD